jgi:hypothetical protein
MRMFICLGISAVVIELNRAQKYHSSGTGIP